MGKVLYQSYAHI